jgi:microcystin-dependent protein
MEGLVGMIKLTLGATPPANWLRCDGAVYTVGDYPQLAAMVGNRFGGDGLATFGVPEMTMEQGYYMIRATPSPVEDAGQHDIVSQMVYWVGDEAPAGWLPCDGRLIQGADYPVLQKVAAKGMPQVMEAFHLPIVPAVPGVKCIICVEGIDPSGPTVVDDDDL